MSVYLVVFTALAVVTGTLIRIRDMEMESEASPAVRVAEEEEEHRNERDMPRLRSFGKLRMTKRGQGERYGGCDDDVQG